MNVQYGIGSISMLIVSHIHNTVNQVIANNNCQSYFKTFEVLFSRKQQGAIRADWKIYPCIFYHFRIDIFSITIFQVGTSISIFSTTRPFLAQCRKQLNVIMYLPMLMETSISPSVLGTTLSPLWSLLLISCSFISFIFPLVFLSFHTSVNTFLKFLAKCLFTLSKLWCEITQLWQNWSHRCLPSILLYFFKTHGVEHTCALSYFS